VGHRSKELRNPKSLTTDPVVVRRLHRQTPRFRQTLGSNSIWRIWERSERLTSVAERNQHGFQCFRAPFITKYGYVCPPNGTNCTTRPAPAAAPSASASSLGTTTAFSASRPIGLQTTLRTGVTHGLPHGYLHRQRERRPLRPRTVGRDTIPGGSVRQEPARPARCAGLPAFFVASFPQQTLEPFRRSTRVPHPGREFNDTIRMQN